MVAIPLKLSDLTDPTLNIHLDKIGAESVPRISIHKLHAFHGEALFEAANPSRATPRELLTRRYEGHTRSREHLPAQVLRFLPGAR